MNERKPDPYYTALDVMYHQQAGVVMQYDHYCIRVRRGLGYEMMSDSGIGGSGCCAYFFYNSVQFDMAGLAIRCNYLSRCVVVASRTITLKSPLAIITDAR